MGTGYFSNNGDTNTSKPPKSLKPTQVRACNYHKPKPALAYSSLQKLNFVANGHN
jgi:hypothetical protein